MLEGNVLCSTHSRAHERAASGTTGFWSGFEKNLQSCTVPTAAFVTSQSEAQFCQRQVTALTSPDSWFCSPEVF